MRIQNFHLFITYVNIAVIQYLWPIPIIENLASRSHRCLAFFAAALVVTSSWWSNTLNCPSGGVNETRKQAKQEAG